MKSNFLSCTDLVTNICTPCLLNLGPLLINFHSILMVWPFVDIFSFIVKIWSTIEFWREMKSYNWGYLLFACSSGTFFSFMIICFGCLLFSLPVLLMQHYSWHCILPLQGTSPAVFDWWDSVYNETCFKRGGFSSSFGCDFAESYKGRKG